MAHENSPSSVMYADFKSLGLKNRDVAFVLLDADRSFGSATMHDRIESRSLLSRSIVHVAPGEIPEGLFNDFSRSALSILGRLAARAGDPRAASRLVVERYGADGEASRAMIGALQEYGIDASMYRNALSYVSSLELSSEGDRALLYLLVFVVNGCTGDPRRAAQLVEEFATERAGAVFRTTESLVELSVGREPEQEDVPALGLARIVGGKLKGTGGLYRIATDERGTEIGSLAASPGAITDVDGDVSRRHARVYKQGAHYYVIGCKSTNGIAVISGADKSEHVVEPPKRDRSRDYVAQPYEIFPTDTLCLGASTRFMVLPLMPE